MPIEAFQVKHAMQATQVSQIGIMPYNVPVSPNNVSPAEENATLFVFCEECDTIWRSKEQSRCPCCARCIGTPYNIQIDFLQLESTVNDMTYGVNDEDDLEGMYLIMEQRCPWFHKDDPYQAEACWIYLNSLPLTDEINHALDFFEFIMNTEY